MNSKSILLVDDEIKVLYSLSRILNEADFDEIQIAQSANEAVEIIKTTPELAIIVSDYHMPGKNGIEFLEQVHQTTPDIMRILLTGAADLEMALDAVNRGNLFRFLLKPCAPETLISAIQDGLRQRELIQTERELLSKTLSGSIKVLVDILAILSPSIFAQAGRLRNFAREMAGLLNIVDQSWEIELAALLSQIGAVTIPHDILKRWQEGSFLTESEAKMVRSIPLMGKNLIRNIPRLENIAEAVAYQSLSFSGHIVPGTPTGENIPFIARILKVIVDYDRLFEKTNDPTVAFQTLLIHEPDYDPRILSILHFLLSRPDLQPHQLSHAARGEKEMYIEGLKMGMVLTRDVLDRNGALVVSKDTVITDVLKYKLLNYSRSQAIDGPVYIESIF